MPQRKAPILTVLVDGVADKRLRPIVSQRSHGGGRMDFARCVVDRTGLPLMQDFALHSGGNHTVEIIGDFNGHRKVYFWGRESQTGIRIDERREAQEITFTIDPWLLGVPVWGQVVWDPQAQRIQHVDRDLVFNPIRNGKLHGNRASPNFGSPGNTALFLDPQSVATEGSREYQGDAPDDWGLAQVVHYLCWQSNPAQRYVTNPTAQELFAVFGEAGTSKDHVRDLRIKPGLYLPDLLDYVLEPFGYGWFVELTQPGRRKLTFFKRGVGRRKMFVGLQRPGQTVKAGPQHTTGSNVAACDIAIDFSRLYNQVRGLGDFLEIEATFFLAPAWPTSKDALADMPSVLQKTDNPLFEENQDVYRKFVLNEAGDYNGLRPVFNRPYDFRTLVARALGTNTNDAARFCVPKRREFLPTLTLDTNGLSIGDVGGCTVEVFNGNSGIAAWQPADGFRLTEDECGVYFNAEAVPEVVRQQRGNALVRVTATIRFDQRLEGLAPRLATSAQVETAELVLDLRDRFHHRVIDDSSIYYVDVGSGDKKSLAEDDRLALFAYCAQIRDAWDIASVTGPVELEGIDWDYEIGDAITKIEGRNLSFNGKAPGTNATHFPTVVGITYDFQAQRTLLQLADWRNRVRFATDKQGIEEPV